MSAAREIPEIGDRTDIAQDDLKFLVGDDSTISRSIEVGVRRPPLYLGLSSISRPCIGESLERASRKVQGSVNRSELLFTNFGIWDDKIVDHPGELWGLSRFPMKTCVYRIARDPTLTISGLDSDFSPDCELVSLLLAPHFLVNGNWWTFNLPYVGILKLTDEQIYEYAVLVSRRLHYDQARESCEACILSGGSTRGGCTIHGRYVSSMFDPPGAVCTPIYLEMISEKEWWSRVKSLYDKIVEASESSK